MFSFEDATRMARQFRKPTVRATTVFRGTLDVGTALSISLWAYLRESRVAPPRPDRISHVADLVRVFA